MKAVRPTLVQNSSLPAHSALLDSSDRPIKNLAISVHRSRVSSVKTLLKEEATADAIATNTISTHTISTQRNRRGRNPFQRLQGVFRGRAVIRLLPIDPLTGNIINTVFTRFTSAIVSIGRRKRAGGVTERNPFSLSIGSSPAEISQQVEGAFTMFSAIPFNFRGGFLVQYWQYRYQGNRLSGQLVNPNTSLSLATNQINFPENLAGIFTPSVYTMRAGSTIVGRITPRQVRVTLTGTAAGLVTTSYAFVIEVVAQRS